MSVRDVACPHCYALPSQPCRYPSGRRYPGPHSVRITKAVKEQDTILERTRAAVRLVNAANSEELKLEAFMGLFHPDLQRDRVYMQRLKLARKDS